MLDATDLRPSAEQEKRSVIGMSFAQKITIFGAGGTGGAIAERLMRDDFREIVLVDIQPGIAEGRALDVAQSGVLLQSDTTLVGGSEMDLSKGSNLVIITAGIGRKPGLSREDLLATNAEVMQGISEVIKVSSKNAFVIVLTNPADILARVVIEATGFEAERVIGQGGILDSARLSTWIAKLTGVSQKQVHSMVLGGHGDHMVPVRRFATIHGIPAEDLLTEAQWQEAVRHTRYGGGEILEKFQTHGAAVTPAHAVAQMVHALCSKRPHILPISTQSKGRYQLPTKTVIGLPAKLSERGVEEVLELPIAVDELQSLQESAQAISTVFSVWQQRVANAANHPR